MVLPVTHPMPFTPFPKITDARGSITFAEALPFEIKRAYWIYDVPTDAHRGGHAHRYLERYIFCVAGSFDFWIDSKVHHMKRPWHGLYVPAMTWITLDNFAPGSVLLALCSREYDAGDYYRNLPDFGVVQGKYRAALKISQEAADEVRERCPP